MATQEEIIQFFKSDFPQAEIIIENIGHRSARLRKVISDKHLRPGGTVLGPVLMEVADVALYAALLGEIGIIPLAVTTSLNINFLRKPSADKDIIAECSLIKVGRALAVGEVSLYSEGVDEPVAHVVGTYSIPPTKTN